MATYLVLNLAFILLVRILLGNKFPKVSFKAVFCAVMVLLVLTMVFDNLIIGLAIVDYDASKILGIRIGNAPVEDFMYTIVVLYMMPVLWQRFGREDD